MRDVRWPVSAIPFLPAALRTARACRYLIYSDADFEVFRPARATRCTSGGEIWHGGGDLRSPPPCQISPQSMQRAVSYTHLTLPTNREV